MPPLGPLHEKLFAHVANCTIRWNHAVCSVQYPRQELMTNDPNRNPGYVTDPGVKRSENQDVLAVRELPEGMLLAVLDGMGGHLGGGQASHMALESIIHEMESAAIQWNDPHQVRNLLEHCLLKANTDVYRASRMDDNVYNMGTTALLVVLQGHEANVGHVGDSRLYLVRGDKAYRITKDHTQVQMLVDGGHISAREAKGHPQGHMLMKAIGIAPQVETEVRKAAIRLKPDDALLLCSDGLYDVVNGTEIARAIRKFSPQLACEKLAELAKQRGGPDNISIVIYRREEKATVGERLSEALDRHYGGIPLKIWISVFFTVLLAAVFIGLAVRAAPRAACLASKPRAVYNRQAIVYGGTHEDSSAAFEPGLVGNPGGLFRRGTCVGGEGSHRDPDSARSGCSKSGH